MSDLPSAWLLWEWQEQIWRYTGCNPPKEQAEYIITEYQRYLREYGFQDCHRTAISLIHEYQGWFDNVVDMEADL